MPTLAEQYPLESTKPMKKTIAGVFGLIGIVFLCGIFFFLSFIGEQQNGDFASFNFTGIITLALAVVIIIFVLKYIYEVFYLKYYFYDATKTELIIRKGVFSRNEITLPFNRIQDIYIDQDILDRIFGLYDVHVSSATVASAFLSHIDGVNKANSEELKKFLLKKVGRKNGK